MSPVEARSARGAALVTRARAAAAVLTVVLSWAPHAVAAIVELAFDGQGRFEHAAPVPPGKFVEVCGRLDKGLAVSWRYDAAQPLDFNIHFHEGKKVVMPEKRDATAAAQGTLQVAQAQDYCWMWTNKTGMPVPLTLNLSR